MHRPCEVREGSITWLAKAGFPIYLTHKATDKTLAAGAGDTQTWVPNCHPYLDFA